MENKNILLIFCKIYSAKPFMAHNRYKNTCQESWRIHQSIQHFSNNLLSRIVRINRVNHPYNSSDNIIEINGTPYNIQWEGKYLIIVDNDRSRIDTLSPISESAEPAITSYLAYLAKEERVKQICFLLAQHVTEFCPIPKNLRDITRLPADIQKKWFESYLEELKLNYIILIGRRTLLIFWLKTLIKSYSVISIHLLA